jgi:quercetin dioxygenase-like cupin family protein
MSSQTTSKPAARTPGAIRAGQGEFLFDLGTAQKIMGGPAYSTAHGPCIEGDRMIVGLMRMKAGTGAEPHSHPNEQWIYVMEGTFRATIEGRPVEAKPGSVIYIPANAVHDGKATPDGDVVFFTVKDVSYGLHGIKKAD